MSPHNRAGKIDGEETIYVAIASYRDPQCIRTIANLFTRAGKPERIVVGVVEQNTPVDAPCVPKVCEHKNLEPHEGQKYAALTADERVVCRWRWHIRLYKLRAYDSLGPTYARHIGQSDNSVTSHTPFLPRESA